jgi:glutamyl-Q tRNA(Asp) synthetase
MPQDASPAPGPLRYRGRFAPSPTGPLHFGSLVAAIGSFLDARHLIGSWLVRMEDLDRAREAPGAADAILRTLEAFGLHWDGPVVFQSARTGAYAEALDDLRGLGLIYPCGCSRSQIAALGRTGPEGPIYPGTCRAGLAPGRSARSLRLVVAPGLVRCVDRIQGRMEQDIAAEIGDFVLRRADGVHAYQLAVVVDDAWQGITDVVRGADLTASTPRQILLQRALDLPTPAYAHLPLVLDNRGRKLSKSDAAAPVDPADPLPAALLALRHLRQAPPPGPPADVAELWQWAIPAWDIRRVPVGPFQAFGATPRPADAGRGARPRW